MEIPSIPVTAPLKRNLTRKKTKDTSPKNARACRPPQRSPYLRQQTTHSRKQLVRSRRSHRLSQSALVAWLVLVDPNSQYV